MINFFTNAFAFVVVLGVLIFIHEFGHFLFARIFGVGVEKFSLGFGPKIWGVTRGITDYRISAIPLGGYVKMVGESPDSEIAPEDIHLSFTHKKLYQKAIIVAAGPVFNLLLAWVIFWALILANGRTSLKPVIGEMKPGSPALAAGFVSGDEIVSIDGVPVKTWDEMDKIIESGNGSPIKIIYSRNGHEFSVSVTPVLYPGRNDLGEKVDVYGTGVMPIIRPVLDYVEKDGPAWQAGLREGDRLVSADGKPVESWSSFTRLIGDSKGNPLNVQVERGGKLLDFQLKPERKEIKTPLGEKFEKYMVGIMGSSDILHISFGPFESVKESATQILWVCKLTAIGMVKFVAGSLPEDNIGGPIRIAEMAGEQARAGIAYFVYFIAAVSANLAVINLFPVPVLDGGHLLFFGIEAIIRRPISRKIKEICLQIGMFLLLALMAYVIYKDIMRLVH